MQEIKGPPDKIKQVELNNIENAKELGLLIITGNIENVPINILIDLGATDNFIHPRLRTRLHLRKSSKIAFASSAFGRGVSSILIPGIPINIFNYYDRLDLYEAPIKYDVILGKSWLRKFNPKVDWTTNEI